VIAEVQRRTRVREQFAKAFLPIPKRQRVKGFAIEVEEIEQEKDESVAVTRVGCVLDQAERGRAVGPHTAQLPVEIGLSGRK
jgi:hypothetical protein